MSAMYLEAEDCLLCAACAKSRMPDVAYDTWQEWESFDNACCNRCDEIIEGVANKCAWNCRCDKHEQSEAFGE